jgi:hypothetical protein
VGAGVVNFSRDGVGFVGGWHPQALAFDEVEASLVVAGPVCLVALAAQPRLTSRAAVLAASARAAHAAFMLQVPVLLSLEIATRPFPLATAGQSVLLGTLAIADPMSLGWLLVKRTPFGKIIYESAG